MRYPLFFRLNAKIGLMLMTAVLIVTAIGQIEPPHDPVRPQFTARLEPPSAVHWLGTDQFGRDVLSRVVAGAGVSLFVSLTTVCVAFAIGVTLGALAGFLRGWTDRLIGMVTDAVLAFPGLLLALAIMVSFGGSIGALILSLGIAFSPSFIRVTRALVLSLKEKEFAEASRALGNGPVYTLMRHILPNCLSSLIVLATSVAALALLAESALSFLGLGVRPPAPSWGGMLSDGRGLIRQAPWLVVFPGLAIFIALLGINLTGDALRDWLDPRMGGDR